MKKKSKLFKLSVFLILGFLGIVSITSCNTFTKKFGGSMSVNVPKGQKVVNCTWKDDDFWYLTRPMSPKDSAEILKFECKSNMGVLEGTVTLIESK